MDFEFWIICLISLGKVWQSSWGGRFSSG